MGRMAVVREQEVRRLEQRRRRALVTADRSELEGLLSDRLILTHTNGLTEGKSSFIASLGVTVTFKRIDPMEETVVVSEQVAVVSARISVTVEVESRSEPMELENRILSVWTQEASAWRLLAYQATRIQNL